jgi:replicative DNA helicase
MMDGIDSLESSDSAEVLSFLNSTINATAETPKLKTRTQVREEIARALELPKACYPTPFKELNIGMGGGLYEGFTYGFCGAEKAGKTTIAHTISNRLDCPHLYIAMEMGAKQIEERNVAKELQMNSLRFLEQPDGLKNKIEQMEARDNVIYLDAPGADLEEVLHNIGMAKIKYGIKGFILDYWQLVTGQQRGESEEKHLRNVAQSMANYARKHGLWCILLAQMNQDGKLFGGNGLKKACDQLYMIEDCGEYMENSRWLRMDASRYTMKADIGSEQSPALSLNTKVGPCFEDYAV